MTPASLSTQKYYHLKGWGNGESTLVWRKADDDNTDEDEPDDYFELGVRML